MFLRLFAVVLLVTPSAPAARQAKWQFVQRTPCAVEYTIDASAHVYDAAGKRIHTISGLLVRDHLRLEPVAAVAGCAAAIKVGGDLEGLAIIGLLMLTGTVPWMIGNTVAHDVRFRPLSDYPEDLFPKPPTLFVPEHGWDIKLPRAKRKVLHRLLVKGWVETSTMEFFKVDSVEFNVDQEFNILAVQLHGTRHLETPGKSRGFESYPTLDELME